jgi:phasin family protein
MNEMPAVIGEWVAPLQRTNQFLVQRLEQWAALQMESLKAYVDLGVAQCKVALKVTDPHSLHEFVDSQFAVLSFVGHRMLDDGRMLAEWNAEGYRQADRLARQNLLGLLFK